MRINETPAHDSEAFVRTLDCNWSRGRSGHISRPEDFRWKLSLTVSGMKYSLCNRDRYQIAPRGSLRRRHPVIAGIVTRWKFGNLDKMIKLFEDVIDNISPTFDIEVRSLRELCNTESGIPRITDKKIQNNLLAKMISRAPGGRVRRHRLIRNLIAMREFARAETKIKLFEKDFGRDGPVHRYKIKYHVERAVHTPGILLEDRVEMLEQAHELAVYGAERYSTNKNVLAAFGELGIEYYRLTGDLAYFDEAMKHVKAAEDKLGDPQVTAIISRFTRRVGGQAAASDEELPEDVMPEADIIGQEPEAA